MWTRYYLAVSQDLKDRSMPWYGTRVFFETRYNVDISNYAFALSITAILEAAQDSSKT